MVYLPSIRDQYTLVGSSRKPGSPPYKNNPPTREITPNKPLKQKNRKQGEPQPNDDGEVCYVPSGKSENRARPLSWKPAR